MGGVEELVIPVRMDTNDAAGDLKKVEAAGTAAGDATAEGMRKAGKEAGGLGGELAGIIKAQVGLAAVRQVASAMGSEYKRAADEVKRLATEFASVREAMQQVAALQGRSNSNEYTLEQVKQGAKAGLTPEEWTKSQESFLNYAGAQVNEKPGDQLEPGAKMTQDQAREFQQRVAHYTKSTGNAPELGMEFAGSILENSKGPVSVDDAMARFNRGFAILQKSRVPIARTLPLMSQTMAHGGVTEEEAATMISTVAPAAPGEEGTAVESSMRALDEMKTSGKGEQFGVKAGMSKYESFKAFGKNIAERQAKLRAAGKNDEEVETEISRQLKEADVASEIREKRGLVLGMARQGVELGGFERYEKVGRETAKDADVGAVEEYERSDQGRAARRKVGQREAEIERGILGQGMTEELEKAKEKVTRSGQLEEGRAFNAYRGAVGGLSGVTPEQQIVNEEAIRKLRTQALDLGINHDVNGDIGKLPFSNDVYTRDVLGRDQQSINNEIKDLLKQIADATKKQADREERPAAAAPAARTPPLTVPIPAAGGGARQ